MRADGFRALGFLLLTVAVVGGGSLVLPRLLEVAGGEEAELAAALKSTEREALVIPVPGLEEPLRSARHSYTRVSLAPVEPQSRTAELSATLDLEGKVGPVTVSSLGLERVAFKKEGGDWVPAQGWAPRLAGALAALEARRKALEAGDAQALRSLLPPADRTSYRAEPALEALLHLRNRHYQVVHWSLRLERDEVLVNEEAHLSGDSPERPVDALQARRLRLVREGREFFFSPTLM
jgi:hypothetical protein